MLDNIQSFLYNFITSTRFWIIIVLIFIFLIASLYVYKKYVSGVINNTTVPNIEFENKDDIKDKVELYIFTVEWCPHSKKAIPIWNELKEEYDGKSFNGYKIIFTQIDGEENTDLADKFKIEGYPTIKLVKGNQVIEYDAKPSIEHLKEFLNSTLV